MLNLCRSHLYGFFVFSQSRDVVLALILKKLNEKWWLSRKDLLCCHERETVTCCFYRATKIHLFFTEEEFGWNQMWRKSVLVNLGKQQICPDLRLLTRSLNASGFRFKDLLSTYHFKLALHASEYHVGEVHLSSITDSLITTLPYRWQHPTDTKLQTAHFVKKLP